MRKIFYLYLSLLLPLLGKAQHNPTKGYRDSLTYLLTQPATDSNKARISFLLSDEWSYTDTLKAKQFLEQGRVLANGNRYLLALYHFYLAQLLFETDKPQAEKMYLRSDSLLRVFKTPEAYYFRARAWHNYGALREQADDSETMLAVLIDKTIPLSIQSGDKNYLARNYSDVGMVFMNQWQYDKAAPYFEKAISILNQSTALKSNDVSVYINAIRNFVFMDSFIIAKKLIDKAKPMITPGSEAEIDFLINEGMYYKDMKQYQLSLNSLQHALTVADELNKPYLRESVMFQQYRTFSDMGKYEQAKDILLRIVNTGVYNSSMNRLMHAYELAGTFARLGDMSAAYKWQKEYGVLLDSISKSENAENINALEAKFRNAENEKKIVELNAVNEKANLTAKSNRLMSTLLGSASLFLLILLVLGYYFYRNNKRSAAQQEQIKITRAMLDGQEAERTRVARDLHDGLGGMLAAVKINLSDVAQEGQKELHGIIHQLDQSVSELRRIAHNMMPEMLLRLGLEASLRDLCGSLMSENLAIDFQYLGVDSPIAAQEQVTIYRIIQELLANVVKHADARNVLLQCSRQEGVFFITIEDDGKGMQEEGQGMGLSNIKSRVAYLNGKMEILSKGHQQGTAINIELHVTA
ncbi:sensor histidine kinase [Chitinophaga niabensis]|uniref:histidine kinase n=1 Tax=Chitinophaga niabensis TaxID=536979 RepID=A0A1N6K449_9BACT|nr:ATP-binding protein [Chitinophaga niabensis]SIO51348.1 Tetratricopeptide repeat-containing protein [Chitinophaga niabensis]